ncbi:MAG: hypothetical protein WA821_03535 [Anaerolineales bacterium]
MADLDYALNQYLLNICITFVTKLKVSLEKNQTIALELDDINRMLINNPLKPIRGKYRAFNFSIQSNGVPTGSAFQALNYLLANRVDTIDRPIKDKNLHDIEHVLSKSISIYSCFVKENLIYLPKSIYLDWETAIIWEFFPNGFGTHIDDQPMLIEYHVRDEYSRLPKLSVIMKPIQEEPPWLGDIYREGIALNGVQYKLDSIIERRAILFSTTPILGLVYAMLITDLKYQYGIDVTSQFIF